MATKRTIEVVVKMDTSQAAANAKKFSDTIENTTADLKKMKPNTKEFNDGMLQLIKGVKGFANNAGFKQINQRFKQLLKEQGQFVEGSKEWTIITAQLQVYGGKLDELSKKQGKFTKRIKGSKDTLDTLNDGLGITVKTTKDLDKGSDSAFSTFVKGAKQGKISMSGLKAAILGTGIGVLFVAAGELLAKFNEFREVSKVFNDINRDVELLTNKTGTEAAKITTIVKALGDTFEEDYNKTIRTADSLTENLGGNTVDNLRKIEAAYLAGGNASGQLTDNIIEYAPQAANAEIATGKFLSILVRAEKLSSPFDKAIDSVKEFGLRVGQQTDGARKGLETAFGEQFTTELFGNITKGSITVDDAMSIVVKKIKDTGIEGTELKKLVPTIFGAAGEDVGNNFILSLDTIGGSVEDLINQSSTYVQEQQEQLAANEALAEAQNNLSQRFKGVFGESNVFFTLLKTEGVEALIEVIDLLAPLGTFLGNVIGFMRDSSEETDRFSGRVQVLGNTLNYVLTPIKLIGRGFLGLLDILGSLDGGLGIIETKFKQTVNKILGDINRVLPKKLQLPTIEISTEQVDAVQLYEKEKIDSFYNALEQSQSEFSKTTINNANTTGRKVGSTFNKSVTKGIEETTKDIAVAVEGSIKALETEIKKLEDQIELEVDFQTKVRLQTQINQVKEQLDFAKNEIELVQAAAEPIELLQPISVTQVQTTEEQASSQEAAIDPVEAANKLKIAVEKLEVDSVKKRLDVEREFLESKKEINENELLSEEDRIFRLTELEANHNLNKITLEEEEIQRELLLREELGLIDNDYYALKNELLETQTAKVLAENAKQAASEKDLNASRIASANKAAKGFGAVKDALADVTGKLREGSIEQKAFAKATQAAGAAQAVAAASAQLLAIATQAKQPFPLNLIAIAGTVGSIIAAVSKVKQLFSNDFSVENGDVIFAEDGTVFRMGSNKTSNANIPRSSRSSRKGSRPTPSARLNPTGGVADFGQRHSEGGIKMFDGKTGRYIGEWERGETYLILSRKTTEKNGEVINQLLYNSQNLGGKDIYENNENLAARAINRNNQAPGRSLELGGVVSGPAPAVVAPIGPSPSTETTGEGGSQDLAVLVNEIRELKQVVGNWPKKVKGVFTLGEFEDFQNDVDSVNDSAV